MSPYHFTPPLADPDRAAARLAELQLEAARRAPRPAHLAIRPGWASTATAALMVYTRGLQLRYRLTTIDPSAQRHVSPAVAVAYIQHGNTPPAQRVERRERAAFREAAAA